MDIIARKIEYEYKYKYLLFDLYCCKIKALKKCFIGKITEIFFDVAIFFLQIHSPLCFVFARNTL